VAIGAHRKVVTVLFCDVVGSTALGESVDPEALQGLLAGYFERMKAIVDSHGGSVEKFIGDAVMAVFGVPVAHEDDALRACRAALEMRDALPELGVEGRIGVNTGEVLAGTEERLATGDAVNVAARLEQAAERGEVLLGAETLALVGEAVAVGAERLLEVKGKSEPVAAHPLLSVREAAERSHASRFVGRERELQQLTDSWDRAIASSLCELVTVVGDPGVGKSRLVAEALAQVEARVVRGRCLSYGEGITYFPVVEVVKQLDVLPSDEQAAGAIRSLLRESDATAGTDEIAWAFRKLLGEQAPLVVCFDDIQWGEETFLDLIESTALLLTGTPLLLLCVARPELLDRKPGWSGTLRLEPLPDDEAAVLVGGAVPDEVRQRIVRASGGNPLFLTEMVALSEAGGEEVEVPATLRALLAARLDQLDEGERRVLERGAVEGELFHRGTVQALAPEETEVTPRLAALVRRALVRPDQPVLPREEAYRFRHLLIRDAAYDALPKSTRAELHRRFAEWLEQHGQSLVELDEIVGYHLAQAAGYLDELGKPEPPLADRAAEHLAAAGRRSLSRDDPNAAASLFERALLLTRPHRIDVHLELELSTALMDVDLARAAAVAEAAGDRAESAGDVAPALLARTIGALRRMQAGDCAPDEVERLADAALPLFEAEGDVVGLTQLWKARGDVANMYGQFEQRALAAEKAIRYARLAHPNETGLFDLHWALMLGPRPASKALETLDPLLPEQPPIEALGSRAVLLAMLDRIDEARELAAAVDAHARELGHAFGFGLAEVSSLAGDDATAAGQWGAYCRHLQSVGARSELSTYAPMLGRVLFRLGDYDQAELLAAQGRELGAPEDPTTQALWRQLQGRVLAQRGEHAEAERLGREAVGIADSTDMLWFQGDAYSDLAEVLETAGRPEKAIVAWREALDRYERKQIIPLARRVRERLAALQETAR
jgi:class 3 adenylate cyclase/tetratricopeptide (TPR) repeat protein